MMKRLLIIFASFMPTYGFALEPLSSEDLSAVSGQGGVYLSGDITINENGGPLNVDGPSDNGYSWQTSCTTASTDKRCGGRIAVNSGAGGGWLVLDNIRGRFSFEGLTLRTRKINSDFDGDGAAFNSDVFEIGLPNNLNYEDASFTIANSNSARPTDASFMQTDIMTVNINGKANLQGNLLIFPTGAP
ncbi:hypothetical protein [Thalassolituus sp. UBA2009]|jgi:hypothetical protein|uniref:hypothetical protein n=1 Tax=Thalassolituus sp. UBA2009 TaxID=1947658 RepID=UPI00257ADB8E|nr:hypothetical protein [Thalassolituus sp. UBA2009]|tara:strand:+ start:128 stop:691 length:564 start_codon:yes stop_codon:yes gene_type:complete